MRVVSGFLSVDDGTSPIGFTACGRFPRVYSENQTVLFDRQLTNYGGLYNSQTLSFICPVDGVYIFTVTISVNNANINVCIMRDDIELTDTWARTDNELFAHATNMVVTECLMGDVVWPLVSHSSGTGDISSSSTDCYTTFSGILIKTILLALLEV